MNIREWVSKHPLGERGKAIGKIAKACGVQAPAVRHWISGARRIDPEHWEAIVDVTLGEVTIVDLLASAKREAA